MSKPVQKGAFICKNCSLAFFTTKQEYQRHCKNCKGRLRKKLPKKQKGKNKC